MPPGYSRCLSNIRNIHHGIGGCFDEDCFGIGSDGCLNILHTAIQTGKFYPVFPVHMGKKTDTATV